MKSIVIVSLLVACSFAGVVNKPIELYQKALVNIEGSQETITLEHIQRSYNIRPMFHTALSNGWDLLGQIDGFNQSIFEFEYRAGVLSGKIILDDTHQAFEVLQLPNGNLTLVEVLYALHNCEQDHIDTPPKSYAGSDGEGGAPTYDIPSAPAELFDLESKPGANGVIYIDANGHYLDNSWWVTRYGVQDLAAASIDNDEYYSIYLTLKEDYAALNLNITTSEDVFNSYPTGSKARIIVTNETFTASTTGWSPISGFDNGYPSVCFKNGFTWGEVAFKLGEVCSHEVGHNLGLHHDGNSSTDYYRGHGIGDNSTKLWGPLMGSTYDVDISHFNQGEYTDANEPEDDYGIMTSLSFGLGYEDDDHSDNLVDATHIQFEGNGDFLGENNSGIITTQTDVDLFEFQTSGGLMSITVAPAIYKPNLDPQMELLDSNGSILETANPNSIQDASINRNLDAGTYFVRIDGVGYLTAATGYTDYGSRGYYTLFGNIPGGAIQSSEVASSSFEISSSIELSSSTEVSSSIESSSADQTEGFYTQFNSALRWTTFSHGIELKGVKQVNTLILYNALGKQVESMQVSQSGYHPWNKILNSGSYMLEIRNSQSTKIEQFNIR